MLELNPDDFAALNNLALIYQFEGDPARALPLYRRAVLRRGIKHGFRQSGRGAVRAGRFGGRRFGDAGVERRAAARPRRRPLSGSIASSRGRYDSAAALLERFRSRARDSRMVRRRTASRTRAARAHPRPSRRGEPPRRRGRARGTSRLPADVIVPAVMAFGARATRSFCWSSRREGWSGCAPCWAGRDREAGPDGSALSGRRIPLRACRTGRPCPADARGADPDAGGGFRLGRAHPGPGGAQLSAGRSRSWRGGGRAVSTTRWPLMAETGDTSRRMPWALPDIGSVHDLAGRPDSARTYYETLSRATNLYREELDASSWHASCFGSERSTRRGRPGAGGRAVRSVRGAVEGRGSRTPARVTEARRRLAALAAEPGAR